MSSSDSISSESSFEPDAVTTSRRRPYPQERMPPRVSSDASSNRPLPDLPHQSGFGHSGQILPAVLRDRPLPIPEEQSAEERRRSIIALDRKRRLTNPEYGDSRRRSNHTSIHERRPPQQSQRKNGSSSSLNIAQAPTTPPPQPPEIIDLTGSSPPTPSHIPQETRISRTSSDTSRRYVVPPWQPDAGVDECPICNRPFTWMFRRHHCRKCGRVVCNECSPHRITIPRQFIVHPPGPEFSTSPVARRFHSVDFTHRNESEFQTPTSLDPYSPAYQLDGGEKVRLCNPCVPDPQPEPLPNYYPQDGRATSLDTRQDNGTIQAINTNYTGNTEQRQAALPSTAFEERVSATPVGAGGDIYGVQSHGANPTRNSGYGSVETRDAVLSWFGTIRGPPSPSRYRLPAPAPATSAETEQHTTASRYHPRNSSASVSMSRPLYPVNRQPRDEFASTSSSSMPNRRRGHSLLDDNSPIGRMERIRPSQNPFITSSRPRLAESDICPICRHPLPPRGPNGEEAAREAHIVDCIRARDPTYHGEGSPGGPLQARVHMLPFIATEKDCVAQDDNVQECSICMVEYDVGDELARLECLCKFHKDCIMEWLGRKAECPVHKLMS